MKQAEIVKNTPYFVGKGKTCQTCISHIDGLVQERRNASALAIKLRLLCTNPQYDIKSIPWLLMAWQHKGTGHQQPLHWPNSPRTRTLYLVSKWRICQMGEIVVQALTFIVLHLFLELWKYVFIFYDSPTLSIISTMADDGMMTQGARASAPMVLYWLSSGIIRFQHQKG